MKGKKIVVIVVVLILTLTMISSIVLGFSIKNSNKSESSMTKSGDPIEIYIGKMTIDCEWDSIACHIDIVDYPYEKLNIDSKTTATIVFYANWEIKNEKTSKEKWFFNMTLRDGSIPDSEIIDNKQKVVEDTFGVSDNQDGVIYFKEIYLTRDDFEKHYFHQKPDVRSFRMTLECIYYEGSWLGGELEKTSDKDLWTIGRIDLNNDKPSAPQLSGDIGEGEKGDISKTYTFTAKSSIDPDGDKIKYVFNWHDGSPSDETDFMGSGGTGQKSHKWNDQMGLHEVSVYAKDRFGAISPSTKITFTLPRSLFLQNIIYQMRCSENINIDILLKLLNL